MPIWGDPYDEYMEDHRRWIKQQEEDRDKERLDNIRKNQTIPIPSSNASIGCCVAVFIIIPIIMVLLVHVIIPLLPGYVPPPTQLASSSILETWKGSFNQPGYAQAHDELDVMSLNNGSFTGIWMAGSYGSTTYDIGQVSVAGQMVLFSSIPSQAQTDLQNSYGSEITMDANTKVVQWSGQGNASGNIWPSGYYYAVRNEKQLEGVAYESQGSELCTFSLQGTGSLGN
jgi:hypothetical protein